MKSKHRKLPCPKCGSEKAQVIDTRSYASSPGRQINEPTIRRRRRCEACNYRFTTYETIYKEQLSEVEELVSKIVHYRREFGVQSDPIESAYEAMAATA